MDCATGDYFLDYLNRNRYFHRGKMDTSNLKIVRTKPKQDDDSFLQ